MEAHLSLHFNSDAVIYVIPCEWMKRIYQRESDGKFVLLSEEFCCRQILRRSDCKLVRCQSICVPSHMLLDTTYFHVGCGPCGLETAYLMVAVPVFLGIKKLPTLFKRMKFESDVLYIVYVLGDESDIMLTFKKQNGGESMYENEVIQNIFKHIVVCKECNKYLEAFITILDVSLNKYDPVPDYADSMQAEVHVEDLVPCSVFLIDGEFNLIREQYFHALDNNVENAADNTEITNEQRHAVVAEFIKVHHVVKECV